MRKKLDMQTLLDEQLHPIAGKPHDPCALNTFCYAAIQARETDSAVEQK